MDTMASQITSLTTIVCAAFIQGADQRKHQSSASLAFVGEIYRWPANSPHKGPVTRKMFPCDDVMMPSAGEVLWGVCVIRSASNNNKTQQSAINVHISWDVVFDHWGICWQLTWFRRATDTNACCVAGDISILLLTVLCNRFPRLCSHKSIVMLIQTLYHVFCMHIRNVICDTGGRRTFYKDWNNISCISINYGSVLVSWCAKIGIS